MQKQFELIKVKNPITKGGADWLVIVPLATWHVAYDNLYVWRECVNIKTGQHHWLVAGSPADYHSTRIVLDDENDTALFQELERNLSAGIWDSIHQMQVIWAAGKMREIADMCRDMMHSAKLVGEGTHRDADVYHYNQILEQELSFLISATNRYEEFIKKGYVTRDAYAFTFLTIGKLIIASDNKMCWENKHKLYQNVKMRFAKLLAKSTAAQSMSRHVIMGGD